MVWECRGHSHARRATRRGALPEGAEGLIGKCQGASSPLCPWGWAPIRTALLPPVSSLTDTRQKLRNEGLGAHLLRGWDWGWSCFCTKGGQVVGSSYMINVTQRNLGGTGGSAKREGQRFSTYLSGSARRKCHFQQNKTGSKGIWTGK